jgi:hypothetical protein
MPELAGNFREHLALLCVDAKEIFVFERDSARRIALSCIRLEIKFKELTPTIGCQISNVHSGSPTKYAAATLISLQPAISRSCIKLRVGWISYCEDTSGIFAQ